MDPDSGYRKPMEKNSDGRKKFGGLWFASFFLGLSTGFWFPALTNILNNRGMGQWIGWAFAVPPICALFSPLIGGALADERIPAQKLLAWSSLSGAILLLLAFGALDASLGPLCFLSLLAGYSLVSGPSWGLLATITLTHLGEGGKRYPLVRVGATVGWIAAGFITSYALHADASPTAGYAGAAARIVGAFLAFRLPHTPPLGLGKSWKSSLGLGAFSLFKNRDHAVLFTVTGLFSIPLAAFYMYSPELFEALGDKSPTASMTVAQWSEIAAMLFLGALMVKYRLKYLLMWGLGLSALRFAMSGYAGFSGIVGWHIAGVALHGLCYTIYFVTAQVYLDRRVDPSMRGQAQGLLTLMASGIGPLFGAFFCRWLRVVCVDETGHGWGNFWGVLAAIIAACWVAFWLMYRGKEAGD